MKKYKNIICLLGCALLLILACMLTLLELNIEKTISDELPLEEMIRKEEGESISDPGGDPGLSEEDMIDKVTPKGSRKELISFINNYIGYIPYDLGGRFWRESYPKISSGIDNRITDEKQGMDSLGFVEWVYFYLSGRVIENPVESYQKGNRIRASELLPGDIGMYTIEAGKNHYGIFLGYDGKIPLFAHCSSAPTPKYPMGVLRLSGLELSGSGYYNGSPAEDFRYFIRPDMKWIEETLIENTEMPLAQKNDEMLKSDLCGNYAKELFEKIQEDKDSVYQSLNLEAIDQIGYDINKDVFYKKMEEWAEIYEERQVIFYNMEKLTDKNAYVARFYIASYEDNDSEMVFNNDEAIWQDMTIFFNDEGIATSFLPFHASMVSESGEWFGFYKRVDKK